MATHLFDPFSLRSVDFRNRVVVSPMCMYSSPEGIATQWHMVHAATRAIGGAGCFMVEATAVEPEGRISPMDMGIWGTAQAMALEPVAQVITAHGCVPGIQLAHAGRKASCATPGQGGEQLLFDEGGWQTIAPSPIPFRQGERPPGEMTRQQMERVCNSYRAAAQRAWEAGFKVLELHMAHGYLLHSFLSPLSNLRQDKFGGTFDNRIRFPLEVVKVVRKVWPENLPLWVRLNSKDWLEGGWSLGEALSFAAILKGEGVDLVDCSSGFIVPDEPIDFAPGFQVGFSEAIRQGAGIPTATVGAITSSSQAETIVRSGQADLICMARQLLREPYWPLRAAHELGQPVDWPQPYQRATW